MYAKHPLQPRLVDPIFQVLDGDDTERTVEKEEDSALMRKVAAESIVLLKNEGKVLPLTPSKLKKVAILGGNAKAYVLSGGGSAALKPSYFISPYEGIVNALGPNVEVTYSEGARSMITDRYTIRTLIKNCYSGEDDVISRQ